MARTTAGPSGERWDDRLGRYVPTGYTVTSMPKGMHGISPDGDVHTFKEGPISRFLNRKLGKR